MRGDKGWGERGKGEIKLGGDEWGGIEGERMNGLIDLGGWSEWIEVERFKGNMMVRVRGGEWGC